MPCYHPLYGYKSKYENPKTGKNFIGFAPNGTSPIPLPCGRCIGCRLERSRQWAIRCTHEMQMHEINTYITLTYTDEKLTYGGATHGILIPRDLTLFWKRLRKRTGQNLRYFACGEYGDQLNRPHYHAIIFGYDFEDKKYDSTSKAGHILYHSDYLDDIWTHGRCIIGNATFESAAYVARYVLKKRLGDTAKTYAEDGISPEFVRMSRRPGIGKTWLDKFETDVFPSDHVITRGGMKIKPPKYYNTQFSLSHPLTYEDIQSKRQELAIENWQQSEPKQLLIKERIKIAQTKSLTRKLD